MAQAETNVTHGYLKELSKLGVFLMKNVRGRFKTLDGKRVVSAGLSMNGSSDTVGIRPVLITPDMVGKTIGQFFVIEAKAPGAYTNPEHLAEQEKFIQLVRRYGGDGGFAYSVEEAIALVKRPFV